MHAAAAGCVAYATPMVVSYSPRQVGRYIKVIWLRKSTNKAMNLTGCGTTNITDFYYPTSAYPPLQISLDITNS